jgi:mannose-6-phosphate isomerase-like protein (cupin superfamily)
VGATLVVAAATLAPCVATAQAGHATDMTAAELKAVFETIGRSIDKQVKIVDIGDDTNVGVGVLQRFAMETEGDAVPGLVHHDVAEIYYIVSGTATLVTGGELEGARELPADNGAVTLLVGPSSSGTSSTGHSRPVAKGDVVVIPAGTFHGFSRIDDQISYLSIRVDPDQVLPAGYVNPTLEK